MTKTISCDDLIGASAVYRSLPFNISVFFPAGNSYLVEEFFNKTRILSEHAWETAELILRTRALVLLPRNGSDAADACEFLFNDGNSFGFRLNDGNPNDNFSVYLCSSEHQKLVILGLSGAEPEQKRLKNAFDFEGSIILDKPCCRLIYSWFENAANVNNWFSVNQLITYVHESLIHDDSWFEKTARLRNRPA